MFDAKAPKVYVGPFAEGVLKGMIETFLNTKTFLTEDSPLNKDYPFDENDSWSWTVKEMKDVLEQING